MTMTDRKKHLPRLEPEQYQGQAYVHWNMTVEDRRTGWLIPIFWYKFRELLTHAAFRYGFTCPMYCLMPDHIHLVWIGLFDDSDQLKGMKFFRKQLGAPLEALGFEFQHQPYDRVLRDDQRQESAFIDLCDYIARNPERKKLVPVDRYQQYKFTGCLAPGYPELDLWADDYWPRFWRTYSFSRKQGLYRKAREQT